MLTNVSAVFPTGISSIVEEGAPPPASIALFAFASSAVASCMLDAAAVAVVPAADDAALGQQKLDTLNLVERKSVKERGCQRTRQFSASSVTS